MFRFILKKSNNIFYEEIIRSILYNRYSLIPAINNRYCSQHKSSNKPVDEREGSILHTITSVFSMSVDSIALLHQLQHLNFNMIKEWRAKHLWNKEIEDQSFISERFQILGSDLAAAHFIVHRGGSVRFKDQNNWIRKDEKGDYVLPSKFVPNLYLEEIDASGLPLIYEGLSNLDHLYYLKSLNLSGCPKIDDWCLSRLHMFKTTLEHLNISNCPSITERGLSSLCILRNLKTLNLRNLQNVHDLDLICLLLEDILPNCKILGGNYINFIENDNDVKKSLDSH